MNKRSVVAMVFAVTAALGVFGARPASALICCSVCDALEDPLSNPACRHGCSPSCRVDQTDDGMIIDDVARVCYAADPASCD